MEDLRNKLLAQGIDATLVDSMLKSMSTKKPVKKAAASQEEKSSKKLKPH